MIKWLNRKRTTALFLLSFSCFSAQFRNGLHRIYMEEGQPVHLPSEYSFFVDEARRISGEIFYQDHQRSAGNNGSFNSLSLIFFQNRTYDFLKTGFVIVPKMNSTMMGKPIATVPVLNNNTWKARPGMVDFDNYDPRFNAANFMYMFIRLNMTNEQVLAHFLNMMDFPYDAKVSKYVQLVREVGKANKISLDEKVDEFQPGLLTRLCKEINTKTGGTECTIPLYKTYIETPDEEKTRKNIDTFYRSLTVGGVQQMTNEYLLPRGDLEITQKDVQLQLPDAFFYAGKKNDHSGIAFYINKIEQQLTYDFEKKTYILVFSVTPYDSSLSSDFRFSGEYFDMLKGKDQTGEIEVKKDELKSLEFSLYPDKMEVRVNLRKKGNQFDSRYLVKNTFKIKKNNP